MGDQKRKDKQGRKNMARTNEIVGGGHVGAVKSKKSWGATESRREKGAKSSLNVDARERS